MCTHLHLVIIVGWVRIEDSKDVGNAARCQSANLATSMMVEERLD